MREEAGLAGGAIGAIFGGGAIEPIGEGADALCAEFSAGKEGGGRLSSSSSSELSCVASVNVGTAPSVMSMGATFGVPSGDELLLVCFSTWPCGGGGGSTTASSSTWPVGV